MKLIKTVNDNYINIEFIKYIYKCPNGGGKIAYCVSFFGDDREFEISEDTYNYLINNYYE